MSTLTVEEKLKKELSDLKKQNESLTASNKALMEKISCWVEDYDTLSRIVKKLLNNEAQRYQDSLYRDLLEQVRKEKQALSKK